MLLWKQRKLCNLTWQNIKVKIDSIYFSKKNNMKSRDKIIIIIKDEAQVSRVKNRDFFQGCQKKTLPMKLEAGASAIFIPTGWVRVLCFISVALVSVYFFILKA